MTMTLCGYNVLIDDEDYEKIINYKYYIISSKEKKGFFYFRRYSYETGKRVGICLHRELMNCEQFDKKCVDHINGNTLDNRKCNLRICTIAQNNRNQKIKKRNTSGHKGVDWNKKARKWRAKIKFNNQDIYLGLFVNINDAADAYAEASKKYHGDFGRTE